MAETTFSRIPGTLVQLNAEEDGHRPVRKRLLTCGAAHFARFGETWGS